MANREGHNKRSSSTPVKWTLVEAEPETPQGQRSNKQGYARSRGQTTGGGASSSASSWRSRDSGRGRGGGHSHSNGHRGGRRGGGPRSHHGQGRGRGYGNGGGSVGYAGGATYYSNRDYSSGQQSYEEEKAYKAYMTGMAVRQIEFYFTVENLCRDIFMRSYMDEEGYIPIAFVANFPGVARFGVELPDITAGILASDTLQVDVENETMRMREGWEVWLLPNQATGKQGVPRYVKVDPSTIPEEPPSEEAVEPWVPREQGSERTEGDPDSRGGGGQPATKHDANGVEPVSSTEQDSLRLTSDGEAEGAETARSECSSESVAVEERHVGDRSKRTGSDSVDGKKELTPTAPAWTPGEPPNMERETPEEQTCADDVPSMSTSPSVAPAVIAEDSDRTKENEDNRKKISSAPEKPTVEPSGDEDESSNNQAKPRQRPL